MKIISLHIESFGKLSNVDLDFKDGLNVIANVNGFGKTTLACFIRAMLYGFTYSRVKGATDVSHYAPWGSEEKFGGSMVVEHNGETYRIERFFGKTARSEQLTVTNAVTNKQIKLSASVGELLLGLTADSYDRSAYFPQEAVELSSNDNFETRLAKLVQNNGVDYDKAQDILRDYRRSLRLERGTGGKIYELTTRQNQCRQELRNAVLTQERIAEIDDRLDQIEAERRRLNAEQSECKRQLDALNRCPTAQSLSDADKKNVAKLNELEGKIARVPSEIDADKQTLDELANAVSHVKNDVKPRVYPNLLVLTVSIVLMIAGAVLCFALPQPWNFVAGVALIALGAAGVVISFVRKGAMTLPAGEKDALISQYYAIAGKYVYTQNLDYRGVVKQFWKFYNDYIGDKRELDALRRALRRTVGDREINESVTRLESICAGIVSKLTSLANEEGRLTQERRTLGLDGIAPQEKIERLSKQIAELEYEYQVAGIVSQLLSKAKDNLSSAYLPQLCSRCQELLCDVTNRRFEVAIDRAFSVQIRENGQTKPMSEFSRGIREITLLCFRIAMSELLYNGTIPFIIIDDAFVNFDEDNFVRATNLLKNIARSGQVIYLTCHRRMGNLLK